jgi:hypothetical protein
MPAASSHCSSNRPPIYPHNKSGDPSGKQQQAPLDDDSLGTSTTYALSSIQGEGGPATIYSMPTLTTTSLPLDAAFTLTTPGGLALALEEQTTRRFHHQLARFAKVAAVRAAAEEGGGGEGGGSSEAPAAAWGASEAVEAVAGPASLVISQAARSTWVAVPSMHATVFVKGAVGAPKHGDEGDRCHLWCPAMDAWLAGYGFYDDLQGHAPAAHAAFIWAKIGRRGGWLWQRLSDNGGDGEVGRLVWWGEFSSYSALALCQTQADGADGEGGGAGGGYGWRMVRLSQEGVVEDGDEAATHLVLRRREWIGACCICLSVCLVGWLVGWLCFWLVGWWVGWLVGWLAGWLVGWFFPCLFVCILFWRVGAKDGPLLAA